MDKQIKFRKLGVMLDQSRNAVMKPETVKKYIDIMAELGYNCLMLYTEDTYEVDNQIYFGHNRGKYSQAELKDMDSYATEKGIELIPCIQTLAHLKAIFRWPEYSGMRDCDDILLCGEDGTYKLIEDIFATLSKCFTSRTVNIGMDEAHMLGRGKYQDKHGYENRFDILLSHLNKVSEIAKKYGFELIMWGDMFFRLLNGAGGGNYYGENNQVPEEVKQMIPDNVNLIYWDYYSADKENYDKKILAHKAIKDNIWFAGGLWTWTGFAPHNTFSIKATQVALDSCIEHGVRDVFVTLWGDNGAECSKFSVLPSLYYAAEVAKGNVDANQIKAGFKEKFGIEFDDFMLLDLPDTPNILQRHINTEKYMLYNDCFMGLFDNTVTADYCENYRKTAQKLENVKNTGEYSVLFDSLSRLCRVLEIKCDLGLRTRKAYESKDKAALSAIICDYDKTVALLEKFYEAYEKQWMWENKPHGFDVQDIRLGALMQRIKHCKNRLLQYINGEIDRIEELEEPLLDVQCRKDGDNGPMCFNEWDKIVTSNIVTGV